ncbi:DUF3830 family protein [Epidermidibacterium keratini]|uniref:DUF3830 family protein n=1 Tax=Epidermidibacterium keratini TaxID=1891644 RepID=A0A7L4YPC3_9ACTN|nr:DUF3830 family protein [Epidermidibacterium keratini]QHC00918.1 DUF3830 family protein [Epidermidibacterium keratini]
MGHPTMKVGLPDYDVQAEVELAWNAAPDVVAWVWGVIAEPVATHTSHACFDGHEVFCFLPAEGRPPAPQNQTMRPKVGDVMFFGAEPHRFAALAEDRLSGHQAALYELAFMYDEVDLRHFWEDGIVGSVVGRVTTGFEEFAKACRATLDEGRTRIEISRGTPEETS